MTMMRDTKNLAFCQVSGKPTPSSSTRKVGSTSKKKGRIRRGRQEVKRVGQGREGKLMKNRRAKVERSEGQNGRKLKKKRVS